MLRHRARDKILCRHPGLIPLLKKIYWRACHISPKNHETGNLLLSDLTLCRNVKFRASSGLSPSNPYEEDLNIEFFQGDLNALRAKVKAWGGASIEKADICLSLFTQQRGKDPVTGFRLDIDSVECHRKMPGGEYAFRNCILLDRTTHQVVHGAWSTVENFIRLLKLNMKRREKLLRLWCMAHSVHS